LAYPCDHGGPMIKYKLGAALATIKHHVPWRLRLAGYRAYQRVKMRISHIRRTRGSRSTISFYCNYHKITGSSVAIACIANRLAERFSVDAYITPLSGYSKLLSTRVAHTFTESNLHGEIVFIDIEQENDRVRRLISEGRKTILSCHAFPTVLHGVHQDQLMCNLALTTSIHFVTEHQRSTFVRFYPNIAIQEKSFVIYNFTRRSRKHSTTGNVGMVGYLDRDTKNAVQGVDLAQRSNARQIQCWGSEEIAGLEHVSSYPKIRINGWTNSVRAIHATFDVLISTSTFETFGLVVVEALSAGIPCFLSDIPVYRELYTDFPGVIFQTGHDRQDIASINRLLREAPRLQPQIMRAWQKKFSNQVVRNAWFDKIDHF
jgi:glycosyltransferase involved in cell wall biosynthesis